MAESIGFCGNACCKSDSLRIPFCAVTNEVVLLQFICSRSSVHEWSLFEKVILCAQTTYWKEVSSRSDERVGTTLCGLIDTWPSGRLSISSPCLLTCS